MQVNDIFEDNWEQTCAKQTKTQQKKVPNRTQD
jgi:hypothetical protein